MFKDGMVQREDIAMKLACGHPHVQPGEVCKLCGITLPVPENKENKNEVSEPVQENKQ